VWGALPRDEIDFIVQYLNGHGLGVEVLVAGDLSGVINTATRTRAKPKPKVRDPAESEPLPYELTDISSPDQYLVQEHLRSFGEEASFTWQRMDRLFSFISGRRPERGQIHPPPDLEELGLVAVDRQSAGFPRPPQGWYDAAVQVGSLLEFAEKVAREELRYRGLNDDQAVLLGRLATFLGERIET
jgi:hypothetical protein